MGESVKQAAHRIAMSIRTGSNGQLTAAVEWVSAEQQLVRVGLVKSKGVAESIGKITVFVGTISGPVQVDFDELRSDFLPEVTEHVVKGLNVPHAEMRGRDETLTVFQLGSYTGRAILVSHIADTALIAGAHLDKDSTEEQLEQFVRGLLEQAERMHPGMRAEVQAKLGEDKGMLLSPKLTWLVKGAALTPRPSRGRRPKGAVVPVKPKRRGKLHVENTVSPPGRKP
jgi:hypothetical protein